MTRFLGLVLALFALGCIVGHCVGCSGVAKVIDEVNDPNDDATLRRCRNEGRAVLDGGTDRASKLRARGAYVDCTVDAGFR